MESIWPAEGFCGHVEPQTLKPKIPKTCRNIVVPIFFSIIQGLRDLGWPLGCSTIFPCWSHKDPIY